MPQQKKVTSAAESNFIWFLFQRQRRGDVRGRIRSWHHQSGQYLETSVSNLQFDISDQFLDSDLKIDCVAAIGRHWGKVLKNWRGILAPMAIEVSSLSDRQISSIFKSSLTPCRALLQNHIILGQIYWHTTPAVASVRERNPFTSLMSSRGDVRDENYLVLCSSVCRSFFKKNWTIALVIACSYIVLNFLVQIVLTIDIVQVQHNHWWWIQMHSF